jgi:hypothetical protein
MSSNFGELVGKNVKPVKTIRNLAQLCGDYINITLGGKIGFLLISFTSQNILREVERKWIKRI